MVAMLKPWTVQIFDISKPEAPPRRAGRAFTRLGAEIKASRLDLSMNRSNRTMVKIRTARV